MADITYIVNQDAPENIPGFEQYSQSDRELINSFEVNNTFNLSKNYMELHIFSLSDELLESDAEYKNYTQLGNAQSTGDSGASILTVDPVYDSRIYGYDLGGVKLLYHFLNDLYTTDSTTTDFFIESISTDRTEVRLLPVTLKDSDVVKLTAGVKNKLQAQSYFDGFRLNFKNNDLFIAVNIDTVDLLQGKAVVVKLYEPLPDTYSEKSKLNIVEIVSDSAAYEVDSDITMEEVKQPTLQPANFNLEISDESVVPTGYLDYNDLFSYPVNNANSEIYSLFNEKGIDVSLDFTDYSDFVHFSSAEERLNNFKYKIDLLTNYSASLSSINATTTGIAGSKTYFENLMSGIVSNFDHYERFLYYESGSSSWPKSNTTRPYENIPSLDPITYIPNLAVSAWYSAQLTQAIAFDRTNGNSLVNAIPSYLKDDESNTNYLTFIYMIGQHFDNLWTFAKAVTDKYDADNRMNHGISKDLVGEALKNFGVKLYTSNKSIEDLFGSLIGQSYQSGSEYIADYIVASPTGSNTPIEPAGFDNYQKEIQKRIYHNLPLLLKSKGTERGLRALINCFGIPSDILQIKYYGGRNTNDSPFFGDYSYYTSSLDKVRLGNTGSIIPGNTLSGNTSNIKRDAKYTDDLHNIEVGFAPSDNVDRYIISHSAATFNIDNYIGDPRSLTSPSYTGLYVEAEAILGSLERYDLQDYVRLIKFFDNVIFKMVKDFIPARVVADTGIIIKPNLLNRSKIKSVSLEITRPEHSGSVTTAFIESTDGGVYYSGSTEAITAYSTQVITPVGTSWKQDHNHEEARYDGELYNSKVVITNGELGKNNTYLNPIYPTTYYDINIWAAPPTGLCIISPKSPGFATAGNVVDLSNYFVNTNSATTFKAGPVGTNLQVVTNPSTYTFTGVTGQVFYVEATDTKSIKTCVSTNTVTLQTCTIGLVSSAPELVTPGQLLDLSAYITNPTGVPSTSIEYYINGNRIPAGFYTVPANAIQANLNTLTLRVLSNQGTCSVDKILNVNTLSVTTKVLNVYVTTAELQVVITNNSSTNTVTEKGIVWSTSPNPVIGAAGTTKLSSNASINAPFSVYPYPLQSSTQYYFKAYTITPQGTTYSSEIITTTKQIGITLLSGTLNTATDSLTLSLSATNPAKLPIKQQSFPGSGLSVGFGGTSTIDKDAFLLEYTSPSTVFPQKETAITITTTTPTTSDRIYILNTQFLQSNTMYYFKAKIYYIQGNSGYDLEVPSAILPQQIPTLTIGQSFQGGVIFKVLQNGSKDFTGKRQVWVLNPSDSGAPTWSQSTAETQAGNTITDNFIGWRLPTRAEQTLLHSNYKLLGTAGTSLSSTTKYYWNSESWISGFDVLRFYSFQNSDELNSFREGAFATRYYVRSIRLAEQSNL